MSAAAFTDRYPLGMGAQFSRLAGKDAGGMEGYYHLTWNNSERRFVENVGFVSRLSEFDEALAGTVETLSFPLRYEPIASRISGTGRVVAGTVGFIAAALSTETIVGAGAAPFMAYWSGDQIGTGVDELVEGRFGKSTGARAASYVPGTAGKVIGLGYDILPDIGVGLTYSMGWSRGTRYLGRGVQSPIYLASPAYSPAYANGVLANMKLRGMFVGDAYEVGLAMDLRKVSIFGMQINHAPQTAQARSLLGDFSEVNNIGHEIGIRLPMSEHDLVTAAQASRGAMPNARSLLASDIWILRANSKAPNSALKKIIQMGKDRYPYDYLPLHRTKE
jgi:hypothetical protein